MESIGRKRWAIAEGYIPASSTGPAPQMTSHETVCLLNTSDQDASVSITIFYSDREPVGPYQLVVPGRRTRHVRFNDLSDPEPIPHDTDFASLAQGRQGNRRKWGTEAHVELSHRIRSSDCRSAHAAGFAPG